jgi:hypothetical protein
VQLVLLAIDAALYPTLLAAVVVLLGQPRRFVLLSAYLAGGLIISIAVGLAIVAVFHGSNAVDTSRSGLSWGADLVVGTLALLLALGLSLHADQLVRAGRRRRRSSTPGVHHEPWTQRILGRGSVPVVFTAALALNLPGAAYLIALKDIAAGEHPTGVVVALVVLFNAIMFTLAEIAWLGLVLAPDRTDGLIGRLNRALTQNSRTIAITLSAALGAFLVARGIAHS